MSFNVLVDQFVFSGDTYAHLCTLGNLTQTEVAYVAQTIRNIDADCYCKDSSNP